MVTQVNFQTLTPTVQGVPGTAPRLFSATSDQTLAVIMTAGAAANLVASSKFKVRDIILVNYDVDGTPGQAMLTVTATSSGSLVYADILLGAKRGLTATYGGGGTSNAFVATGVIAGDIVVATIKTSANSVSVTKAVATTDTVTVTFSADPGAGTTVQWHALPA